MLSAPVIKVEHLSKRYASRGQPDIVAVDDVSFTVAGASCVALLGGNGAGKTTTIAMLLGLLLPTAGTVEMLGVDMVRHRFRALPRINFSSPYVELPNRLTVRENLEIYARLYGLADHDARIAELARDLDFERLLERPAGRLSAGQKTRIALAKALLNAPDVLLLDEPTASLDPDSADRLRGYLEAFRDRTGAAILMASHNMAEVERLCDDVLMMRAGRIVDRGAPADLIDRYGRQTLEQVFLDIARERGRGDAAPEHQRSAAS
jgi:ABC-2 type transport system ATP-binding protein